MKYEKIVETAILNNLVKIADNGFILSCSVCNKNRILKTRESVRRAIKYKRICNKCAGSKKNLGKIASFNTKCKMSQSQIKRYSDPMERKKTSLTVSYAMHRPNVRTKHLDALHNSKWLKVKTDKGQVEFIEKWNRLGFNFQINYQIHTDTDLFYIDGYDKEKNIVLEYDTKYHLRSKQHKKDLIRQNRIIELLHPKIFWRFDSVNKKFNIIYKIQ